jgi:iron complex outermembrane receptor protein
MGSAGFRRADTAESASRFLSPCLLILALALAHPGAAEDAADDDAPVHALGEVTVTATRAERDALEVPGNVTVIDREEIERSGARSVPELLQREPGLFLTSSTSNPAGLQVESRGFANGAGNGSSLLVQVNGRRVNEADSSITDWALIELDEVESIEIVRGPASALYGDNAIGGVIDIRTRPVEGPPRATLRGRFGRYDSAEGSLKASATVGPVTGSLFVNGLTTDGYRHGADFDSQDVKGSLQARLGDRVLFGVSGGRYHDDRDFPGSLAVNPVADPPLDEVETLGRRAQQPGTEDTGSETESRFVEGWLDAVLAESVLLRIQPYYRWRDDDASFFSDLGFGTNLTRDVRDKDSTGVNALVQVDRPLLGLANRLILGFDWLRDRTDRDNAFVSDFFNSLQVSDNRRNIYAGFVQEELDITETLRLSTGVRFDRAKYDLEIANFPGTTDESDPDYSIWSPKAGLTWRFLPGGSTYFSYSRGFRLPNFDEIVSVLSPTIPDLDAQKSDSFEIGAKWSGERIDATLALYWMNVHDEIILNPLSPFGCFDFGDGPICFGQNENFERTRHRGIELNARSQLLDWLLLYCNYTFDDATIRESDTTPELEGARIPITPKHRGNLGLVLHIPHDLEFTAHALFVGERIPANDFDRRVAKLDPYATLDLLLAWRPSFGEHLESALTLALRNVSGEEYDGLAVRSTSDPTRVGFYPAAKRTWEVGFVLTVR